MCALHDTASMDSTPLGPVRAACCLSPKELRAIKVRGSRSTVKLPICHSMITDMRAILCITDIQFPQWNCIPQFQQFFLWQTSDAQFSLSTSFSNLNYIIHRFKNPHVIPKGQLSARRRLRYERQKGRRLILLARCRFVSWKLGGFLIK